MTMRKSEEDEVRKEMHVSYCFLIFAKVTKVITSGQQEHLSYSPCARKMQNSGSRKLTDATPLGGTERKGLQSRVIFPPPSPPCQFCLPPGPARLGLLL